MFKTRLLSGIVLVIIAVASIAAGGPVLFGVLLAISLIGVYELYKAMGVHQKGFTPLEMVGYIGTVLYYLTLLWTPLHSYFMMAVLFALVLIMSVYVFSYPKYQAEQIMAALFGVIYVAVMLSYIFKTRNMEGGGMAGGPYLSSWGSDTCAYCVGMLFGKHKMAPVLSPKKSVEGGVGGVLGAALLGGLYAVAISGVIGIWTHTSYVWNYLCSRCINFHDRRFSCFCY